MKYLYLYNYYKNDSSSIIFLMEMNVHGF